MLYIDLTKAITKAQAKAKHPKLPEGGVWRTIKGQHVYIKDGKVLAGAGVGKTGKPIKLTKQHLAEHQAHVDKKAKAPAKKTAKPKKATAPKATAPKKAPKKTTVPKATAPKKAPPKPKTTTSEHAGKYHVQMKHGQTGKTHFEPVLDAKRADFKDTKHEFFYHKNKMPSGKYEHRISEAQSGMLVARGQSKAIVMQIAQERITKHEAKIGDMVQLAIKDSGKSPYYDTPPKPKTAPKKTAPKTTAPKTQKPPTAKAPAKKAPPKKTAPKAPPKPKASDFIEVYHGTGLPRVAGILEKGFRMNGDSTDFGRASYFKSPVYDPNDDADHLAWYKDRQARGHQMEPIEEYTGRDTASLVNFFADMSSKGTAVIHARIPKAHVLDCSNGRPPALEKLIDDLGKNAQGDYHFLEVMGQHLLKRTPSEDELYGDQKETYRKELKKAWGRDVDTRKVSPYELYAKANGYKVVVDKLKDFTEEGWQIGVYDPKIIEILGHGKSMQRTKKGVELLKALMKSIQQHALPYCLIHTEMKDGYLHLYVGALEDTPKSQDLAKGVQAMRIYNVNELNIVNHDVLEKSALSGGRWITVRGRHVYIKDGTIMTGELKGKKLSALGSSNKGEGQGGHNEGKGKSSKQPKSEPRKATSVGDKATANTGRDSQRPEKTGQNGRGSEQDTGHIRSLSKKEIKARSDREYTFHVLQGKEGASAFHKAIMASKAGNDHGAFVHAYEPKEYEGMHMFISEGGEAGFAMKPNGDICSLFHNPKIGTKKGVLGHSIELGLQHGGNRLDCFDGFLPKQYAKWGFEPVAKVSFNREYAPEGWNFERDGEPDVLFFAHNGDSLDKVLATNYPMPDLGKTPLIEDYDDGLAHQEAYLESRKSPVAKSLGMHLEILKSISVGW